MNWNDISNILVMLGTALVFVSVFLMFREYAWMIVAEQHLIPAMIATFILAIIFFGASAVIRRALREE